MDKGQYLSFFIAASNQRKNFMMGVNLPDEVYDNAVPVFIRQDHSDNFITNLRESAKNDEPHEYCHVEKNDVKKYKRNGRYANIYPFGMCDTAYYIDETAILRAKLINYLYSCNKFLTSNIWKDANEKWKELSVAHKWSNLYNAYSIPYKLASIRAMRGLEPGDTGHDLDMLTEYEIQTLAPVEHNRWNVEKLLRGYIKAKIDEDKYEQ